MSDCKIYRTTNYDQFEQSNDNRPLDLQKHTKLVESMREYGFIKSLHIICKRNAKGQLIIKAGQHRFAVAKELGLPVWYTVEECDFDLAKEAATAIKWNARDFALKWASKGIRDYLDGLEFAEHNNMPVSFAFALLNGSPCFSHLKDQFQEGEFRIKAKPWAEAVARVYNALIALSPRLKGLRFLEACAAVCHVSGFDHKRMVQGAEGCREKLVPYATRDLFLDMLEEVYNFRRRGPIIPLKVQALNATRDRNPANRGKEKAS